MGLRVTSGCGTGILSRSPSSARLSPSPPRRLGAYGLTRLRWRGSNVFGSLVLVAYLMPVILLFIPMYQILARPPVLYPLFGLTFTNKLLGLQIVYPAFALPFATWLLMGYYASIPEELENAALIDGCNRFQAWYRVVLPLAAPALMAAGLFAVTLGLEGVHLRLCLPGQGEHVHAFRRFGDDDYRRRTALGRADGRSPVDGHPGGDHLHGRPEVHGRRPHRRRSQGVVAPKAEYRT